MRRWTWCLLALALMAILPVQAASVDKPLTRLVVVGNHAPPYRVFSGDQASGIYFDLAREVGQRLGIRIDFVDAPMKRAHYMLEVGEADAMVGPNQTPERDTYLSFLEPPLPTERKVFLALPGSPCVDNYEGLSGKIIGVSRGAVYFDRFDADTTLRKQEIGDYAGGLRMLAARRIDYLLMPEQQADFLVASQGVDVRKCAFAVAGRPSYFVIGRKSPAMALRDPVSAALAAIQRDGTWNKILQKYRSAPSGVQ
jgi:polar amino acid transport system substrate-binding protein